MDKNGWISIDDRLPETEEYILLSFENFSVPVIGRYEEHKDGGAFYAGDEDKTLASQYMFVNAWMPLPKPYSEERQQEQMTNADRIRNMSDEELADAMLKFSEIGDHASFCVNSTRCDEIMDAGEQIPEGMCRQCLLEWLRRKEEK